MIFFFPIYKLCLGLVWFLNCLYNCPYYQRVLDGSDLFFIFPLRGFETKTRWDNHGNFSNLHLWCCVNDLNVAISLSLSLSFLILRGYLISIQTGYKQISRCSVDI